jgi:hypothetical protein
VVSLISRETGEVRSRVVPSVNGDNLRQVMDDHLDVPKTALHTDSGWHYGKIVSDFGSHSTVNHRIGEYVRGDVSTNQAENYFSQLKRSLDGTHATSAASTSTATSRSSTSDSAPTATATRTG